MTASLEPRLVVLTGPTAVGKSAVAMYLAQRVGAEILAADSRQVYRFMDIGTAKPTTEERATVPHHLIDVVDPDQPFSVADYQRLAERTLDSLAKRRCPSLLVGGSPHYVQAVVDRLELPPVPPDPELRTELENIAATHGALALHRRLSALDPAAAARADPHNARRLVRALEVILSTGQPLSVVAGRRGRPRPALLVALTAPRAELYARIDARIDSMLSGGWVDEVEALLRRGYSPQLPSLSATGYRELVQLVRGEMALPDALHQIRHRTHAFARRQYTWLRRDPRLLWYDTSGEYLDAIAERVDRYLANLCPASHGSHGG
jgi:tRNA dimethylallyltransferase